ncbi:MAG: hypothetical protein ACKOWF_06100 [Chloroflexota bacterium]
MARYPRAEPIYALAGQFRQRCLIGDTSLLWPDARAWTAANIETLRAARGPIPGDLAIRNRETVIRLVTIDLGGAPEALRLAQAALARQVFAWAGV